MAMSFSLQIAAFVAKTKRDLDDVVRYVLQDIDGKVLSRSPVGDPSNWAIPLTKSRKTGKMHFNAPKNYVGGRFRGNWQLSIGSPATGILDLVDKDGSATKAAHAGVIATAKAGGQFYLTNNLPYAIRLENGWSRNQAPLGMVAITVVEWGSIVDNAVNGVRAGTSVGDFAQGQDTYKL